MRRSPGASAMRNPSILSATPSSPSATSPKKPAQGRAGSTARGRSAAFDACQIGVVLRTVVFVEVAVAAATMFLASTPSDWLLLAATVTGGALPATLLWLLSACGLKKLLGRLPLQGQYAAGALLGAVSALYGCALLRLTGVVVAAPWFASALAGALVSGFVMAALVLRSRGQTPAATTARLFELQSRIRPHFLFNTLNSAIALVREEPAKAEAMLEDLSELFRQALADPGESVTLADEIALAERYLAIEQVRFGERLKIRWDLDAEASAARLPPLLLQPLVENAVKHGVEPSPEGGKLRIRTERRGSMVVIEVVNSLPPLRWAESPLPRGHGIALANVRDRLRLLHDMQAQFSAGMDQKSYRVRIAIPAET